MQTAQSKLCAAPAWPNPEKDAGLALLAERGYEPVVVKKYKDMFKAPDGKVLYWRTAVAAIADADHLAEVKAALARIEAVI